jgi:capsule biosynthesis phosphatase
MRICIDFDGVISQLKKKNDTYDTVLPIKGAVEKIKALKNAGHYLIIFTARHMKTCEGNIGLVNSRIALSTLKWLERYEIPYDEIFFGKPWADVYIDDNAFRFTDWSKIDNEGKALPISNENSVL